MILKDMQGVIKRRQNTIKVPKDISQKGLSMVIETDSRLPDYRITEVKNIRTVKHVIINDPIQPTVTLVTAPRKGHHA